MIIITKDDNSKKKLLEIIQKELEFINSSLNMQKNLSTQVFKYFKELATDIDVNKDAKNMDIYLLKSNKVNEILQKSNKNISEYEKIFLNIKELVETADNLNVNELIQRIDHYNNIYRESSIEISANTSEIESFLKEITPEFQDIVYVEEHTTSLEDTISSVAKSIEENKKEEYKNKINTTSENIKELDPDLVRHRDLSENTLIISEQEQKVILPYTFKKLNNILKANPDKYTDIYDVIDKIYTKPIKYFKNAPVARFREAYKLAKDRENMSFKGALDLAFECFFNSALHPAIISSCDNLNQLDVYLSCLEYDELEDFYFFDIIYKIPPLKSNKTDMFKFF